MKIKSRISSLDARCQLQLDKEKEQRIRLYWKHFYAGQASKLGKEIAEKQIAKMKSKPKLFDCGKTLLGWLKIPGNGIDQLGPKWKYRALDTGIVVHESNSLTGLATKIKKGTNQ